MSLMVAQGLGKWYGAEHIFDSISFQVARGDKVALVGPNGAGKSTLLKIIAGLEDTTEGSLSRARGLRLTYQAQEAQFAPATTLIHEAERSLQHLQDMEHELRQLEVIIADTDHPDWPAQLDRYGELQLRYEHAGGYEKHHRIERTLHGLGFSSAQWEQPMGQFSGGQRTRAALALALLGDPDVLLLDEPTNHLDIQAREALEQVLNDYNGTILFVSHDRYFIDAVADSLWVVEDGQMGRFEGNYTAWSDFRATERRAAEQAVQAAKRSAKSAKGGPAPVASRERKQLKQLEQEIARLEARKQELDAALTTASARQDSTAISELGTEYTSLDAQLADAYDQWALLADAVELA